MIVVELPVESFHCLAEYDLQREYISDKDGTLSSAFDGELYHALADLGRACADDSKSKDAIAEAVWNWQQAVNAEAKQYADKRVHARAAAMYEDQWQ